MQGATGSLVREPREGKQLMARSDATGPGPASQPFSWKLFLSCLASVCLVAGLAALLVGAV